MSNVPISAPMPAPAEASSERLEVRSLTAGYGGVTVLRDVDLVVPEGELVALLGPNGAGKTTLLRAIFGLTSSRRGQILYGGKDVSRLPTSHMSRLGICYITDRRAIFPTLTVEENLRMFAGRNVLSEAFAEVFSFFPRLAERRRQGAGTLSGGEQQMLALARAMMSGVQTLIIDELSMGLAPRLVDELFEFLDEFRRVHAVNILLVEQYAHRALALADLVYVINRGTIAFGGEPGELQGSPELMQLYLGESA